MLLEEFKANARKLTDDAWNKGNLEMLDDMYATSLAFRPDSYNFIR